MTQKITTHLWFDKEAKEAAEFYTSVFGGNSKITSATVLEDTPSGSVDIVNFQLLDYQFTAISAGPLFKFNPSISFSVSCKTKEEVDDLWNKLLKGGKALMELGSYPFSERYGWVQDKYGLSWQIISMGDADIKQRIIPVIMFTQDKYGKVEEAMNFYVSTFKNSPSSDQGESKIGDIFRYPKGQEPEKEGAVAHAFLTLKGLEFAAMESAQEHNFIFNEAISFMVHCENQKEIDYYWEKLSAVPESEQCGWLKDKYGVSWQIVPTDMKEMMSKGTKEQIVRVTQAFLKMKKFDVAKLKEAYDQK